MSLNSISFVSASCLDKIGEFDLNYKNPFHWPQDYSALAVVYYCDDISNL